MHAARVPLWGLGCAGGVGGLARSAELVTACKQWRVPQSDLQHFVAHPGGVKVIEAYAEALGLPVDKFATAFDVLKNYGNMSSASVLFVLERFLHTVPPSGKYGVMLALGPGFSSDQVLFQW